MFLISIPYYENQEFISLRVPYSLLEKGGHQFWVTTKDTQPRKSRLFHQQLKNLKETSTYSPFRCYQILNI